MTPSPPDLTTTLTAILANTYALAVKTHGAHWNVTGTGFFEWHERFGEQYEDLLEAADELAERLRALGSVAPGGINDLARLASLPAARPASDGTTLITALLADHRTISQQLARAVSVAQDAHDEATADLFVGRIREHDKTAWMLSASLV